MVGLASWGASATRLSYREWFRTTSRVSSLSFRMGRRSHCHSIRTTRTAQSSRHSRARCRSTAAQVCCGGLRLIDQSFRQRPNRATTAQDPGRGGRSVMALEDRRPDSATVPALEANDMPRCMVARLPRESLPDTASRVDRRQAQQPPRGPGATDREVCTSAPQHPGVRSGSSWSRRISGRPSIASSRHSMRSR